MLQHPDKPVVETTTEVRASLTGHIVRNVLMFGLGRVVVAFVLVFLLRFAHKETKSPSGVKV